MYACASVAIYFTVMVIIVKMNLCFELFKIQNKFPQYLNIKCER